MDLVEVEGVTITERLFKRIKGDQKIVTAIIPAPELGYYKSMTLLLSKSFEIVDFCELDLMERNPQLFKEVTENEN